MPSLSLEPEFRRSHGSLYKSLAEGSMDEVRLRQLLVEHRPKEWPLVFAVDASTWDRCDAECSPERGFYYSASKHSAGQPIVAGWSYQWICQLDWAFDSWTAPLDMQRIPPRHDAADATIEQIRRLVGLLPDDGEVPLFVFDAGYNPIALGHGLADERCECLTRIRDDRVFYADPPPRPNRPAGTGGRPPRHGRRFKCSDPKTWAAGIGQPRCLRPPLWHRQGEGLARSAPSGDRSRTLARARRRTTDRPRHRHPRRGRALAQAHLGDEKDPVAVLVRGRRA